MTREETRDSILQLTNPNILCELPTSFGKSKIALDLIKHKFPNKDNIHILIVIPRLVLIDNWKEEFKKWGMENYLDIIEFVTYVSFPKKCGVWDMVIFDEAHHLSDRCRDKIRTYTKEGMPYITMRNCLLLSATVGRRLLNEFISLFDDLYICTVTTKQAIEADILPDPMVCLIPMYLDNVNITCQIVKNKTQKKELIIPYSKKFDFAKVKNRRIVIPCTQKQYYDDMSSLIRYYKKAKEESSFAGQQYLRKSGERLKWLSEQKSNFVKYLLTLLYRQRTLTFCNSIAQTAALGTFCINSENTKQSMKYLELFNNGDIDHITACNMLDEGINLVNCRVGVYAVLNSSERMIKQKLGRLLRHPKPVIIIPYFVGTRDEEIVKKMLEDYNPELVKTITNLKEFKDLKL